MSGCLLVPATNCHMHIQAAKEAGRADHQGQDEVLVKEPLVVKGGEE